MGRKTLFLTIASAFLLLASLDTRVGTLSSADGFKSTALASPKEVTEGFFKISVSSIDHNNYGLAYPVTYCFNVPEGSLSLRAYKRYSGEQAWFQVVEKKSTDFFNGIEAVRFDYPARKAYVSVVFSDLSDEVYVKITDVNGNSVPTSFSHIPQYYDNRKAVVTASADDWNYAEGQKIPFVNACDTFRSYNVCLTVAVITNREGKSPDWTAIQTEVVEGCVEVASHSRSHVPTPYSNYDFEVGGSKSDIIGNLSLPYKKGAQEYVYAWIEPYGLCDNTVRQNLGYYHYLVDRSTGTTDGWGTWNSANGLFSGVGKSIEMGNYSGVSNIEKLNNKFDTVYNAGGIYHLMCHPQHVDWTSGSYAHQHLQHIRGKTDVWYVGFGYLYLYHYVQVRNIVTVEGRKTIKVPENYPTIQGAVNAATLGDVVLVSPKTYYERVAINKSLMLVGENPANTVVDGGRVRPAFYVTADNVEISGFTVQGGGGIYLDGCGSNVITGNILINSNVGITLQNSEGNYIYHNNFINNTRDVSCSESSVIWNNGAEGNYWSNYTGTDLNGDGIGDSPYIIDENNRDDFPLMAEWSLQREFTVQTYKVVTFCSSTVASFDFSQPLNRIGFNITGPANTLGFCNISIPKGLLNASSSGVWAILLDASSLPYTLTENGTHTFLYFTYAHSIHRVWIYARKVKTTLIINAPSTTTQGKTVSIVATLKDENENPIFNATVEFFLLENETWETMGSIETDSSGVASLLYMAPATGTLQIKAMYAETQTYNSSSSNIVTLNVGIDYTPYILVGGIASAATIVAVILAVKLRTKIRVLLNKFLKPKPICQAPAP